LNNRAVAIKYLKLIFLIGLVWASYSIYKSGLLFNFNKPGAQVMDPAKVTKKEQQKLQATKKRLEAYVTYFSDTEKTLKTLEASSSIDIKKDLHLNELFLEKFTP
jgi:hypothetical protein